MTKVLIVSDCGVATGYGRIADEIGIRMRKRGYDLMALSYFYDGLLPAQYDGTLLPYHVGVLTNKPNQLQDIANVIGAMQPDIVLSIQDFPYHTSLFSHPSIDWSKHSRVLITPVDGTPILPSWLSLLDNIEGALTISQFGVDAFADAGHSVDLCRPGINPNSFFRVPSSQRLEIRAKLGLDNSHFLLGTMAQNQGRKGISLMLKGFFDFAKGKPNARYLLDMDPISPAGWDIMSLCEQQDWDKSKLIMRHDALRMCVMTLNERYNALDAHVVIAHREGYGLPLAEAMACGVVSMAQDYCSGPEIIGDERGVLVKTLDYAVPGTWGGAEDRYPDMEHFVDRLNWLHDNPHERAAMAERGMKWARQQTWDNAADSVIAVLERVQEQRQAWAEPTMIGPMPTPGAPVVSPDGQTVEVMQNIKVGV